MSKINYVLDQSNLEVRMIDQIIPKVANNLYKQGQKTDQPTN